MSEGQPNNPDDNQPSVKVVDRRRFRPDGEPVDNGEVTQEAGEAGPASEPETAAAPAEDPRLAIQAARIDELTRAYSAMVQDNKAFRDRMEREKERALNGERTRLIQALFESADELERTLSAVASVPADAAAQSLATLVQGVQLTMSTLSKRLGELGATRYSVVGERFDPRVAEAIDTVVVSDPSQDEVVIQELRPGYRVGEKVLRPALVRVGRLARA